MGGGRGLTERKALASALVAFGAAIFLSTQSRVSPLLSCGLALLGVIAAVVAGLAGDREYASSRGRRAGGPSLEIEGLSSENVQTWRESAVRAFMADEKDGNVARFEAALDHLVGRRGPLDSRGRPVIGRFRLNGRGGFEPADAMALFQEQVLGAFSVPMVTYESERSPFPRPSLDRGPC